MTYSLTPDQSALDQAIEQLSCGGLQGQTGLGTDQPLNTAPWILVVGFNHRHSNSQL